MSTVTIPEKTKRGELSIQSAKEVDALIAEYVTAMDSLKRKRAECEALLVTLNKLRSGPLARKYGVSQSAILHRARKERERRSDAAFNHKA